MVKAWQDYRLDLHGKALRPWRDLVRSSLKRLVGDERPRPEGRAGRIAGLERVLRHMRQRGQVWLARRDAIARHWLTRFGEPA